MLKIICLTQSPWFPWFRERMIQPGPTITDGDVTYACWGLWRCFAANVRSCVNVCECVRVHVGVFQLPEVCLGKISLSWVEFRRSGHERPERWDLPFELCWIGSPHTSRFTSEGWKRSSDDWDKGDISSGCSQFVFIPTGKRSVRQHQPCCWSVTGVNSEIWNFISTSLLRCYHTFCFCPNSQHSQ